MSSDATRPTLYFDGACPVCAKEVALYQKQEGACAIEWVDVARCAEDELGADLSRQDALTRLHFRQTNGELIRGVAAFAALWQSLPRWAWAGRFLAYRPILWLAEPAYLVFLKMRRIWR